MGHTLRLGYYIVNTCQDMFVPEQREGGRLRGTLKVPTCQKSRTLVRPYSGRTEGRSDGKEGVRKVLEVNS